jgi:hypothetical protein
MSIGDLSRRWMAQERCLMKASRELAHRILQDIFGFGIRSPKTVVMREFPRSRSAASFLCPLACLMLLATTEGWAQKTSVVTTVRMSTEPGRAMVGVPCKINGVQRRYVCVIDSGATYTVVSDRVIKAEGPIIEMTTGNGVVRVHQREVMLTIAEALEFRPKVLVQDRMIAGVDILLGEDVLRQFRYIIFDYENRKVEFQQ